MTDIPQRLALEYDLDEDDWSADLLEQIGYFLEVERDIVPPKVPRIKVSVEVLEEDCR